MDLVGLLPDSLLDSPPESPPAASHLVELPDGEQQPTVPTREQSAVHAFLKLNILQPEAPLLQHPSGPASGAPQHAQEEQSAQGKDQRRSSARLADKPTAKMHSIARCQTVLMKKLDILPASQAPREEHKKRLINLFSDAVPPQAIAAIEDLLSEGNPAAKVVEA
jgi:hypothetical protein